MEYAEDYLEGGCHCGGVKFRVGLRPRQVLECNCSICSMTGYLHFIVPRKCFEVIEGGSQLTSYRFGSGKAEHLFCRVCGVKSFYVPRSHPDGVSVNLRCLRGIDPERVPRIPFDGRDWEKAKEELNERKESEE